MSGPLPPAPDILRRIVESRRQRLRGEGGGRGHAQGVELPPRREAPRTPFGRKPFLVCEIKRCSPSRGEIAPGLDAPAQAGRYADAGVRAVSVLTEEAFFHGSLADLVEVKRRHPDLAVLRKDFLLDEEDLEVSDRAGADAVLLIAAVLDAATLARLARRAGELGLAVLVEVHDEADVEKARAVRPAFTGINSRDLSTFRVDPLAPLRLKGRIDWPTRLVFESGVRGVEDGRLALAAGFDGLLVGEAVVRSPGLAGELLALFGTPPARGGFWARLAGLAGDRAGGRPAGRPLVKICGITRAADARLACGLGADLLGFVFAPSPRRADPRLLRELRDLPVPKVGVTVGPPGADPGVRGLLEEGLLDAVQLHGDEGPGECAGLAWPWYKAVRLREPADVEACARYGCPRMLADAWAPGLAGGTGRPIREELLEALAAEQGARLWVAGGIGPDNVRALVRRFRPELIDASSRLEAGPGVKDPALLARFFREVNEA